MRARKVCLILLLLILAAAGSGAFLVWKQQSDAQKKEEEYAQMRREPETLKAAGGGVIPVDFEKWQAANPEIYAWITIPGTSIDAPVLQSRTDNAYYLNHSAQGLEDSRGAIFSEDYNSTDFSDVHTVLYGQNAQDGTVFAELHRFGDEEFFKEHQSIAVFTPDAVRYYRIFAAYRYDDRHLLQSFDCTNPGIFRAYIKEIMGQRNLYAQVNTEVSVGDGDRILTLSTGHNLGSGYRYLVQAVLTEEIFAGTDALSAG
ncbi:MAG: class B sortase [Eubacteriales bacterium]|nr:class B sortase [Eubacteriales bacterium]